MFIFLLKRDKNISQNDINKENLILQEKGNEEFIGNENLDSGGVYSENERDFIIKLKSGGTYAYAQAIMKKVEKIDLQQHKIKFSRKGLLVLFYLFKQ